MGSAELCQPSNLFNVLAQLDFSLEPVFCGGPTRTMQEREQWGSGCNFFAVGPGQLLSYGRNEHTLAALENGAGLRIVSGDDFLSGSDQPAEDERFVITFDGGELVRGGGGARCMTLPVEREDLT